MKNKITRFVPIFLMGISCLSLGACNKNQGGGFEKVKIDYGTYRSTKLDSITSLPELGYNDLVSKVSHKDSFLLAIYNETCTCWADFAPVLTEFINDTNCNVDYINVNKFIEKDDLGLYLVKGDLPSIAIFRAGKLAVQSVYLRDDRKMFKQYKDHFEKFIEENVILPKMFYVDKTEVDKFIDEDKEFNLYLARRDCGDCQALERDVLLPWSNQTLTIKENLYVFDMQQYYALNPEYIPMIEHREATQEDIDAFKAYCEIKAEYKMDEITNPELGFGTGAFPTLQRRKGNDVKDMCVVLNDSVDKDNKVISSYFTESRVSKMKYLENSTVAKVLHGMQLTDEQIENWRASYKEEYDSTYHYPIAKEFIKYYIG